MSDPSSPAAAGVLFLELAGTSEPAPPMRSRGSRVLRTLARIVLWSLIAAGAFRGLMPAPQGSDPAAAVEPSDDRRAEAVAAAFLREYLTVGDDRTARAGRLRRLTVAGVDLGGSVSVPTGVAQYADHVVVAGSTPDASGIEVTVLAHVLQLRSGVYRDGGTLAFVVPMAVRREEFAVRARPRPATLPIASGLSLPRPQASPNALSRPAGRMARQAVQAFVAGNVAALARLGGGQAPSTQPFPPGWQAIGIGDAEVTGPAAALTAQVPVRVRPPTGPASYIVPVRVRLVASPRGLVVREIDGGSP
jgi:hypothetical protein